MSVPLLLSRPCYAGHLAAAAFTCLTAWLRRRPGSAVLLLLLLGALPALAQTPPGNALNFDGQNDFIVSISSGSYFNYTVEAWVRTTNAATGDGGTIVSNYPNFSVGMYGGKARFRSYNSGSSTYDLVGTTTINDGKWHHVAAVMAGGINYNMTLYVDGVAEGSRTGGRTDVSSTYIGALYGSNDFWQGSIDEVRIWGGPHSAAEIKTFFNNAVLPTEAGLLMNYTFDRGTAGGNNAGQTTEPNPVPRACGGCYTYTGTLYNFALSGSTSNLIESYALMQPTGLATTSSAAGTSITATWTAPPVGPVTNYVLDCSTTADYSAGVTTVTPAGSATSATVPGRTLNTTHYLRLRADKASVTDQGAYSRDVASLRTGSGLTPPGNALAFDGSDDHVRLTALPATGEFTLEGWVNPTAFNGGLSALVMADDFQAGAMHCQFYDNNLGFTLNGNSPSDVVSTTALPTGRWSHVAVVYSASAKTVKFYVNGVLNTAAAYTTAQPIAATACTLGGWLGGYALRPFRGKLDEVRLYRAALTQAQVQADMTSTTAAVPASLVAYYDFDQGTAGDDNPAQTTLVDRSPNYQDGTLRNFGLSRGNTTSNFVESYALVLPTLTAATAVTATGFTANWTAPALGTVDSYVLDYSTSPTFAASVATVSPAAGATSQVVSGLLANSRYYFRLRANKASVANQGAYTAPASALTLSALPLPGNALDFYPSLSNYVSIPDDAGFSFTGATTVEAWVNTTTSSEQYITTKGEDSWLLAVNGGGGASGQASFALKTGFGSSNLNWLHGTSPVADGRWHYVVGTYDGAILRLYVDGVLENSRATTGLIRLGTSPVFLGNWTAGFPTWTGRLDEVRIWSVARSAASIRAAYASWPALPQTGLVASYNFDQGTANGDNTAVAFLTDQSGNQHDGTLNNFSLSSGSTTSNFVESYALVVPTLTAATGSTATGFTANWTAPALGTVNNYVLDYSTSPTFAANVTTLSPAAGATSQAVSGLDPAQTYYYRVRPNKSSVSGQGANSLSGIRRPTTPPSPPGNALAFDGTDDYVAVAPLAALDNLGASGFTLEAWVKPSSLAGYNSLVRKSGDYSWYLTPSGQLGLEVWPQGPGNATRIICMSTSVLTTSSWAHVAATWDGTTARLYLNGVDVSGATQGASTISVSEPLQLGQSAAYGNPLSGLLDEVRIYSAVLTLAQVQADMTSTTAAVPASQLLYYNFDQGTAGGSNADYTTVANQAATDAYGTLTNFALTGSTSNWVESYALVVPTNLAATAVAGGTSLAVSWTAPTINGAAPAAGTVQTYSLEISTSATFASINRTYTIFGYSTTSTAATGLTNGTDYYLRLRAQRPTGSGQGCYTPIIAAHTLGTDARLTSLVPSAGQLTPDFFTTTSAYTLYVGSGTSTYTLTPTASNAYTSITVNGTAVASGAASAALAVGSTATVVVTSEDLRTTATYTVQAVTAPGYFRSVATGYWSDASSWEASPDGSSNWEPAPVAPTGSFVGTVTVRDGTTVTVAAATSTKTTTVESGGILNTLNGQTLTIPGGATMTVNVGGVLSIGQLSGADGVTGTSTSLGTFSVAGASALTVNGTLVLNTNSTTPASQGLNTSTTIIGSSGRVVHFATSVNASMPVPTWRAGSTLELAGGIANQTYAAINQTLQNLDVNLTGLPAGTPTLAQPYLFTGTTAVTVAGTLTVRNTGAGTLRLFNAATTGTLTLGAVDGSGTRTGGYVQLAGTSVVGSFGGATGSAGTPITVQGGFQLSGGTFAAAQGSNTAATALRTTPLTVNGDFTVARGATFNLLSASTGSTTAYTGGTVALNGSFSNAGTVGTGNLTSTTQKLLFGKAGPQAFLNTGTISGRVNAQVNSGTTLDLGTSAFTGTGTFATVAGATLRLGSPAGISASGTATGNVQSTTRTFAAGTNFELNGTVAQVTGPGFPTALASAATLAFNNPAGVTLSQALTTVGTLSFRQGPVTTTATSLLTLGSTATTTGTLDATATNTGSVAGPFRRWVAAATGSRDFPVGTATASRPATIDYTTAPTAGGTLTAEFVASPAGSQGLPLTEGGTTVDKGSDDGYWRFTAANGLTDGTYTATFTFTGITGVSDYGKLLLLKRAGATADWTLVGTGVATTGSNAAPVLSRTGLTGFSDFTAGLGTDAPLPVELVSFTATGQEGQVRLRWRTASEKHSAYFEVQASADGRTFRPLGQVAGQGTTTHATTYAFTDADAARRAAKAGVLYYRLRQVDLDGTFTFSPIRAVSLNGAAASLALYPNPARQSATLTGAAAGAPVQVVDALGRLVLTATADATGTAALVLPAGLPAGVYLVRTGTQARRLVVE